MKGITQFCTRIEPQLIFSNFEGLVESQLFWLVTLGGSTGENHIILIKQESNMDIIELIIKFTRARDH